MIKYKSGYKYQLVEAYARKIPLTGYSIFTEYIILDVQGNLVIKKGYAWDGATGVPDFKFMLRASVVHDALYQLIRLGLLPTCMKKKADVLFSAVCKESALSLYKDSMLPDHILHTMVEHACSVLYKGVEWFGSYGLGPDREIIEVP